jgi:hypothetical protein
LWLLLFVGGCVGCGRRVVETIKTYKKRRCQCNLCKLVELKERGTNKKKYSGFSSFLEKEWLGWVVRYRA